jgi:hypothetical protein
MTLCVGFVVQEGLLEVNAAVLVASLRSFYGPSLELVVRARPHRPHMGGCDERGPSSQRLGWMRRHGCPAPPPTLFGRPQRRGCVGRVDPNRMPVPDARGDGRSANRRSAFTTN